MQHFSRTSGLYHMFDVLQDVYVYNRSSGCLSLYEEVPVNFLQEFLTRMSFSDDEHSIFTMHFTYGAICPRFGRKSRGRGRSRGVFWVGGRPR